MTNPTRSSDDRERLTEGRGAGRGDAGRSIRGDGRDDDDDDPGCLLASLDRPRDWQDVVSHVALFAVLAGLVLACIGYLFPRSYRLDPRASARENEAVELYYWRLGKDLDTVLLVGMGLIGLGGIMTSFLFFVGVVWPDCKRRHDSESVALTSVRQLGTGSAAGANYGATSASPGN